MNFNAIIIHDRTRKVTPALKTRMSTVPGAKLILVDYHQSGPATMHYRAWQTAMKTPDIPTLILEDDAIAYPWTEQSVSQALDDTDLSSPTCPAMLSFYRGQDRPMDATAAFHNPTWTHGHLDLPALYWTVAYLITPAALPTLTEQLSKWATKPAGTFPKTTDMSAMATQLLHGSHYSCRYYTTSFFSHDSAIPQSSGHKHGRTAEQPGPYNH